MSTWLIVTISTVSLIFSCVSTVIAGLTAFLTLVRRPKVKMTQPTFVAFAFDGVEGLPKIFTRTLMYSTSQPGKVVESLFAKISQNNMKAIYTFWGYAMDGRLVAGGGLFVGPQGIVTDHHFVLGKAADRPVFSVGPLDVAICARVVGEKAEQRLFQMELELTEEQAKGLNTGHVGVGFERSPDSIRFQAAIEPVSTAQRTRTDVPVIASIEAPFGGSAR